MLGVQITMEKWPSGEFDPAPESPLSSSQYSQRGHLLGVLLDYVEIAITAKFQRLTPRLGRDVLPPRLGRPHPCRQALLLGLGYYQPPVGGLSCADLLRRLPPQHALRPGPPVADTEHAHGKGAITTWAQRHQSWGFTNRHHGEAGEDWWDKINGNFDALDAALGYQVVSSAATTEPLHPASWQTHRVMRLN